METPFSQEVIDRLECETEEHVLTMFYMDRAKGSSNMKMRFNLLVGDYITDITKYKNGVASFNSLPKDYDLFQLH